MEMLREHLSDAGEKSIYLNLDVEWDRAHFDSQHALVRKIELELGKDRGYVFIDEIQRKENAGLFLKGLFDLNLPCKFIVSGSGSLELKEKIHESLAGRKRLFELTTLSFEEFVNHRTEYRYRDRLRDFFQTERDRTAALAQEYMSCGGYPRVALETGQHEKRGIINDIYRSVVEKDVAYLLKVDKPDAFTALVKLLAARPGSLVNYAEISSAIGLSMQTVKKYFWYAQKIFIADCVTPFSRNARKEITLSPVCYFHDLGLRNYALGLFGREQGPAEGGFLFQNFVYLLLKSRVQSSGAALHYWRTKDKAEVDFVIENGRDVLPVEVKYSSLTREEIPRSLRSFVAKYRPAKALMVNLDTRRSSSIGDTEVRCIPYYDLLFEEL